VGDVDKNFSSYCNVRIETFIEKYHFDIEINREKPAHENLNYLFSKLKLKNIPIYVMIDEYDKFNIENEIICKDFFRALRISTSDNNSSLKKIFTIGTLPSVTMDITNGGAISANISELKAFNNLLGITKNELTQLLKHYNLNEKLSIDDWYDSYKFNRNVKESHQNQHKITMF